MILNGLMKVKTATEVAVCKLLHIRSRRGLFGLEVLGIQGDILADVTNLDVPLVDRGRSTLEFTGKVNVVVSWHSETIGSLEVTEAFFDTVAGVLLLSLCGFRRLGRGRSRVRIVGCASLQLINSRGLSHLGWYVRTASGLIGGALAELRTNRQAVDGQHMAVGFRIEVQVDGLVGTFLGLVPEQMQLTSVDGLETFIGQLGFALVQVQQRPSGREHATE